MGEKGFFVIFGIVIIAMFLNGVNGNLSGEVATSTDSYQQATTRNNSVSTAPQTQVSGNSISQGSRSTTPVQTSSNDEIKEDIEDLYDELWEIEQALDKAKRRGPVSRYANDVSFSKPYSYSYKNSPDREYLSITVNRDSGPINISRWYVESYVTDKRAAVPDGVPVYKDGSTINHTKSVVLEPGQRAFLITGESPLKDSFQENSCIGYVTKDKSFYPNVTASCESPIELMERYGDIELDDDSCYDFVRRIGRCETIEEDDPRIKNLSGKCERFIENTYNYRGCVDMFGSRTEFDDVNDWYLYFERSERLWRDKREIIRLMDEYDEVIAVLEY